MMDTRTMPLFGERVVKRMPVDSFEQLRWYQQEAVLAIERSLGTMRSTMLVLATGLGKTQVFSSVAHRWKEGRVLVLAHRDELVNQARDRLEHSTGEHVEVEQAQLHSYKARLVVGSVQSVYQPDRLERLHRRGGFGLIVVDECHHCVSHTYRSVLDRFPDAKVLGVTATPDRGDAQALGKVFDDVSYTMDLRAGIEHGYLVPLRGKEVEVQEIDLDGVKTVGGDLAAGQLDEATLAGVEGIVKGMLYHSQEKQGVIFFPGVDSANLAAERLNALKPGCAAFVSGETPTEERRLIMERFKRGDVQFLSNCMVATEGFDAPSAAVIGLARPTKSRSLYAQMVGRGTRALPGLVESIKGLDGAEARRKAIADSGKNGCLIVDFVGNNSKHALITPHDLLGGDYTDAVRKKAKELAKEGEEDVASALEKAQRLMAKELEQKQLRTALIGVESRVKSVSRDFDPFHACGIDVEQERKYALEYGYKPASKKQRMFLMQQGISESELAVLSSRSATKVIGKILDRKKKGLASTKQSKELAKSGVDARNVSAKAAAMIMKAIMSGRADPQAIKDLTSDEEF